MKDISLRRIFVLTMLGLAIYPYIFAVSLIFTNVIFDLYGRKNFKKTYIKSINTPSYKNTKKVLEEFNKLGDNKIVSFIEITNGRPIEITEMTTAEKLLSPEAVGLAYPRMTRCSISIEKGLPELEFREVLIHEYLHCYGYDHINDPKDLMYNSLNYIDKEENIMQYAKKVKKKFYE